jgi:ubiquinone/menaquinone biosynthesis C-methylase UbiE
MILDVCVGGEKIYQRWQENLGDEFLSIDIRKGDYSYQTKASVAKVPVVVKPKVLADMKYLPFKDGSMDSIVCDPPHMDCGLTGFMAKAWGSWDQKETVATLKVANKEFSRVLKPHGTLILKIMPNLWPTYKKLLSNFIFFLPIQSVRAQGCMKPKELRFAAFWAIGTNNPQPNLETQLCEMPRLLIGNSRSKL